MLVAEYTQCRGSENEIGPEMKYIIIIIIIINREGKEKQAKHIHEQDEMSLIMQSHTLVDP